MISVIERKSPLCTILSVLLFMNLKFETEEKALLRHVSVTVGLDWWKYWAGKWRGGGGGAGCKTKGVLVCASDGTLPGLADGILARVLFP